MQAFFTKLIAFFTALIAFFFPSLSKNNNTTVPGENGYAWTITADKIEFAFNANDTTGYTWSYEIDGKSVTFTGSDYKVTSSLIGAPGVQYYRFSGIAEGDSVITFKYARSWEDTDPVTVYTCKLSVDSSLKIAVASFTVTTQKAAA